MSSATFGCFSFLKFGTLDGMVSSRQRNWSAFLSSQKQELWDAMGLWDWPLFNAFYRVACERLWEVHCPLSLSAWSPTNQLHCSLHSKPVHLPKGNCIWLCGWSMCSHLWRFWTRLRWISSLYKKTSPAISVLLSNKQAQRLIWRVGNDQKCFQTLKLLAVFLSYRMWVFSGKISFHSAWLKLEQQKLNLFVALYCVIILLHAVSN